MINHPGVRVMVNKHALLQKILSGRGIGQSDSSYQYNVLWFILNLIRK